MSLPQGMETLGIAHCSLLNFLRRLRALLALIKLCVTIPIVSPRNLLRDLFSGG